MAAKLNQDVRKGDTFSRTPIYRIKATKAPIDLTGATASGSITKGTTVVPFTCAIVDAAGGQFSFGLSSSTTATLEAGTWAMQVKLTFADTTVKTLFTGNFVVYD
jgi:hypothetical protein